MGQEAVVFEIVKSMQPIRTEQVKIEAMKQGVSCADRYLRWLHTKHKIFSYRVDGNMTKTWETA